MAASVLMDTAGSRAWEDTDGVHVLRVGKVTGFQSITPNQYSLIALKNLSGVPKYGEPHPYATYSYLRVHRVSVDVDPADKSTWNIEAEYRLPTAEDHEPGHDAANAVMSVDTVTVETETQFDIDNVQIYTAHNDDSEGNEEKVFGSVKVFTPTTVVTYERREPTSPGAIEAGLPLGTRAAYAGKLNSVGVFGDDTRTWLCTEVSGSSNTADGPWLTRYAFARSPKVTNQGGSSTVLPWDALIIEVDPTTGNFVEDPVIDKGMKIIKVHGEADFNDLSLTVT